MREHLNHGHRAEGKIWRQEYEEERAYPVKTIGGDFTGTVVTFTDKSIFTQTTEYNYDTLIARLRELSYLNKGITITLTDFRTRMMKEMILMRYSAVKKDFLNCQILRLNSSN